MDDIAVITANFGRRDQVREQAAQDVEVEWHCFTDDADRGVPEPWKVTLTPGHPNISVRRGVHPNMVAKCFKLLPNLTQRFIVWIDANMEVTSSSFVREAVASISEGVATFRHPRRDCIYDEAEASLGSEGQGGRYEGLGIEEQVAHYRAMGYPEHAGLYACGTVAWDHGDVRSQHLGFAWLGECARWTYQDQLSFPVACWRLGITPGVFDVPQIERVRRGTLGNRWLTIHPHL